MAEQQIKLENLLFPSQPRSHTLSNQLQPRSASPGIPRSVRLCLDAIQKLSGLNKIIAEFMLCSGCRVHEVLQLEIRDISETGHVLIRAGKRSQNRVVYFPALRRFAFPTRKPPNSKVFPFHNYWKFYRSFRSAIPGAPPRSRFRNKITNLLRCAAADLSAHLSRGDSSIPSVFLGHKSPRSTDSYLQTKGVPNG